MQYTQLNPYPAKCIDTEINLLLLLLLLLLELYYFKKIIILITNY